MLRKFQMTITGFPVDVDQKFKHGLTSLDLSNICNFLLTKFKWKVTVKFTKSQWCLECVPAVIPGVIDIFSLMNIALGRVIARLSSCGVLMQVQLVNYERLIWAAPVPGNTRRDYEFLHAPPFK